MSEELNGARCWEKRMWGLCVAKKLKIPKFSRPESGKIDEKNKTYVEMVCTKLRKIKPLVLKAYRTKNNLSKEQRKSLANWLN